MKKTNPEMTLLSAEQVFEEGTVDLIRAAGAKCRLTDYAVLTGADSAGGSGMDGTDEEGGKRYGVWFLRSPAGAGDVAAVNREGRRAVAYASSAGGLRPALCLSSLSDAQENGENRIAGASFPSGTGASSPSDSGKHGDQGPGDDRITGRRRHRSGFVEIDWGEYPQAAADRETSRRLESEFACAHLRKTGKRYDLEYEEYLYKGNKYIRARWPSETPGILSNGRKYREGDPVWIRVTPLPWLEDPKSGVFVTRDIIAFADSFTSGNTYDGNFEGTEVYRYINSIFREDLKPSEVKEMSAEEKAAFEAKAEEERKKRNPYGLTFGEVSEEDIIRGAIESDVAVFLHGPSSEGKSARVKQIDPTCEIIYLRNATPDSLNGRSVYNQSTGEMIDIPPTWYKKVKAKCEAEPDRFHVVFFDEINNALPSIQGMAFNIVLDREVNGLWKLPENARVVAAGNDMQDSLAANQIAAPFFNRFAHVYINTTTEKWLRWARENRIHPAIYAYIAYRQGETLRSEYDGEKPNADPRKWEMASRMLYTTGRPEMLRSLIGEEITDEFVRFCSQPVITLQKVLDGEYRDEEIRAMNTAERYATVMGLSQAEEKDLKKVRSFAELLGAEYRGLFDSLWTGGDERREAMLHQATVDDHETVPEQETCGEEASEK